MVLQDSEQIKMTVKDRQGNVGSIEIAPDAAFNLMEVLKTFNYKMRATCGGMGLCADCHCRVVEGYDSLPSLTDQEIETLDLLPNATGQSRLSCQIPPGAYLRGTSIELLGKDHY